MQEIERQLVGQHRLGREVIGGACAPYPVLGWPIRPQVGQQRVARQLVQGKLPLSPGLHQRHQGQHRQQLLGACGGRVQDGGQNLRIEPVGHGRCGQRLGQLFRQARGKLTGGLAWIGDGWRVHRPKLQVRSAVSLSAIA